MIVRIFELLRQYQMKRSLFITSKKDGAGKIVITLGILNIIKTAL